MRPKYAIFEGLSRKKEGVIPFFQPFLRRQMGERV